MSTRSTAEEKHLYEEFTRINNELVTMHRELAKTNDALRRSNEQLQAEITRREEVERQLAARSAALARSNGQLREFAFAASHDLREPLRTLTCFSELLTRRCREQLDEDARQQLDFIAAAATRMQAMIDGLLACAQVESTARPYEPTDCNALVDQVLAQLQALLDSTGAAVVRDRLPVVSADPVQLGEVFQNLITNAIKFRGARPPMVFLSSQQAGDHWLFSVRDNGIGIDPMAAGKLFRIFGRLHGPDEFPGSGIGLALCKQIIERHGGRIWFDSQPGDGTTFYFTIASAEPART